METTTQTTAEAATATAEQTTAQTTEKEVTLDDVYRDAGLDKPAAQETTTQRTETTQTREAPKPDPSSVPDPYDTERFKDWAARQAAGTTELHKAVTEVTKFLTTQQQRAAAEATKADIEKSVKAVDEIVQIGKPKVIEAYLDGMVREDARMKALWDNRAKNPTAWTNALKIVAKKMSEEFSVKTDPNLQKSQRALKESQKQMATTADNDAPDQEWDGISQEEFERRWQAGVRGWS